MVTCLVTSPHAMGGLKHPWHIKQDHSFYGVRIEPPAGSSKRFQWRQGFRRQPACSDSRYRVHDIRSSTASNRLTLRITERRMIERRTFIGNTRVCQCSQECSQIRLLRWGQEQLHHIRRQIDDIGFMEICTAS